MELSFFQRRQLPIESISKYSSSVPSQSDILKRSTHKIVSLDSSTVGRSSRKRIRRQNSIEQSVTNYFKQNKLKVASFLKIDQEVIHLIHPTNLVFPQPFKILQDGLYILIRGGIKMITFSDQKPPYRSMCRQIINNAFRMMKNNKDLGMKVLENGSVIYGKQLQKKNYYRNNNKGKNEVEHGVNTVTKAFSVLECVNQNCLNFSPQTILYRIQEDDAKQFQFKQKKEEMSLLLSKNNHILRNHSMFHHTIQTKIFNFRNFIQFSNVAIIKRGFVKVTKKSCYNPDFIKQQIQYQKIVCELGEGSVLVQSFCYEVASAQVQIIQIQQNDSFQLLRLPEWASAFINQTNMSKNDLDNDYDYDQGKKTLSQQKIKKKSAHLINLASRQQSEMQQSNKIKKPLINKSKSKSKQPKLSKTKSMKQHQQYQHETSIESPLAASPIQKIPPISIPSLLTSSHSHSPSPSHFLKQKFFDYLPNNQKLRKIKFKYQISKKSQATNSIKLAYQIVNNQNIHQGHFNGQINNKKIKQKLFFKAMSPYLIISEKIGIKQMMETQKLLKRKPELYEDEATCNKASKLQRLKSIQFNKANRLQFHQRRSWQNKSLHKMVGFLSKENQCEFLKQSKQNVNKMIKSHKKSYSEMSTFYGDSVLNKCREKGTLNELGKLTFYKI